MDRDQEHRELRSQTVACASDAADPTQATSTRPLHAERRVRPAANLDSGDPE
jgi:hypothetical protein